MHGSTKHCYILDIRTLGLVLSETKIFSFFFHYEGHPISSGNDIIKQNLFLQDLFQ